MNNIITSIIIILIVIVFTILLWGYNSRSLESNLLTGFWRADPEFCQEASLDHFILYFGDKSLLSNKRNGYVLIQNNEGIIINDLAEFNFSNNFNIKPIISNRCKYNININWYEKNDYESFFPCNQILIYYPLLGKIILLDGDNIKAVLYKDYNMGDNKNLSELEDDIDM